MDIQFGSRNEERLCTEEKVARAELGAPVAKILKNRLNQLLAAANLAEVVLGTPHPLLGNRAGCFGIWLDKKQRLVVRPANDPVPVLPDGGIDRSAVTIVCIEFIGNYHNG